jgi:hypothetical protein
MSEDKIEIIRAYLAGFAGLRFDATWQQIVETLTLPVVLEKAINGLSDAAQVPGNERP